jgi:hypothetical protein
MLLINLTDIMLLMDLKKNKGQMLMSLLDAQMVIIMYYFLFYI